MSLFEPVEVACPVCACTTSTNVCRSLNVDLNPEARAALFDGTLNRVVCFTCGHRAHVVFDMAELVRYVYFREQLHAQRYSAGP